MRQPPARRKLANAALGRSGRHHRPILATTVRQGRCRPLFVEGARTTMQVISRFFVAAGLAAMVLMGAGAAWAGFGQPSDWQIGPQEAVAPVMDQIVSFHTFLLWVTTIITVFVLVLLVLVVVKFNARANPTPSATTCNSFLAAAWTLVPGLIRVTSAVPSFRILFYQLNTWLAAGSAKAPCHKWLWANGYPDNGKFEFDS